MERKTDVVVIGGGITGTATLAALARALGCPLESLSDRAELPLAPGRIPGVGRLRDLLGGAGAEALRNAGDLLPVARRRVPLLGSIAAGRPIYAEETVESALRGEQLQPILRPGTAT